jgi:lipid-A-disaccharide synthase
MATVLRLTVKIESVTVQFLISAGEASGDLYASGVVHSLSSLYSHARFYGCAGPKLQAAGVEPVIDAKSLAVVGLAEVVEHLPRIYGEYRKLIAYVRRQPPDAALLTDSPDFHLRLARHLKKMKVPVYYLVAPQVWAWRQNRVKVIRKLVDKLFCLFPFEEQWFRERGVDATYIGHPLATIARTTLSRDEFLAQYRLPRDQRVLVILPGSRTVEACRHLPVLLQSVAELRQRFALSVILATPRGFYRAEAFAKFRERIAALSIQIVENDTWNCIGHADLALAASGTVTMEAAILGTPTVTFYKVSPLTWAAGRRLVKVPFLSMVNLIAERQIVPEFIQHEMTASHLTSAAEVLLSSTERADRMRAELGRVRALLTREGNPFERAASLINMDLHARMSEFHAPQETIK